MPLIEILPYDPGWPDEFTRIAGTIREALGEAALRIHHIGSTSVPGLAAKDVIDLQVAVERLDVSAIEPPIVSIGYRSRPEIDRDHLPPGAPPDPGQWAKLYFSNHPGDRRVHIHVRVLGAANQRYAVLFRDYLRANSAAAEAYGQVKLALAPLHPDDIDAYYDVKDPVCDVIIAAAELWAARIGYGQPGTDA